MLDVDGRVEVEYIVHPLLPASANCIADYDADNVGYLAADIHE